MYFELTQALIDDILFCMEDQNNTFILDTENSLVMERAVIDNFDNDRYIAIPEWGSADGYHMMERFTTGFQNPLVRDALNESLAQGKGVFRAFKQVLSKYPEAEKLWFAFKKKEMQKEVLQWYNGFRENWNMERIGGEPEETCELFLEDFVFRAYEDKDFESIIALHQLCFEGKQRDIGDPAFVVETANQDFAGFIAVKPGNASVYISSLEVRPEYRGLGIASELCARLVERLKKENNACVYIDLPNDFSGFSRFLFRSAFKPIVTRYCLDLLNQN
jgi:GNAT superfamily N-acetyltransferase